MEEVEKHVAWYQYLSPIRNNQFNMAREGDIEPEGDDTGRPIRWNEKVQDQMKRMKAFSGTVSNYAGVQNESVEQQIERIDQMLSELVEVRRYRMIIELDLEIGEKTPIEDYKDAIRACAGVTTVNTTRSETRDNRARATFSIKFALKAQESRKIYMNRVFFPYIKGIVGVTIGPAGYSQPEQVVKLREGSILEALPTAALVPQSTRKFPTPRVELDQIVSDWAEGGVMAYDTPMDANNMGYHVMVPVAELRKYISRYYRASADMFHGKYKNFIRNGPTQPVYLAIGQNGRCKITGNEDDVWYAAKSGLEELPVFFSYQKQV